MVFEYNETELCQVDADCVVPGAVCFAEVGDLQERWEEYTFVHRAGCSCLNWYSWAASEDGDCSGPFGTNYYILSVVAWFGIVSAAIMVVFVSADIARLIKLKQTHNRPVLVLNLEVLATNVLSLAYNIIRWQAASKPEEFHFFLKDDQGNPIGKKEASLYHVTNWTQLALISAEFSSVLVIVLIWATVANKSVRQTAETKASMKRVKRNVMLLQGTFMFSMLGLVVAQKPKLVATIAIPFVLFVALLVYFSKNALLQLLEGSMQNKSQGGSDVARKSLSDTIKSIKSTAFAMQFACFVIIIFGLAYTASSVVPKGGRIAAGGPGPSSLNIAAFASQMIMLYMTLVAVAIFLFARRVSKNVRTKVRRASQMSQAAQSEAVGTMRKQSKSSAPSGGSSGGSLGSAKVQPSDE